MSHDIGNLCPPIGKNTEIRKIDLRNKRNKKRREMKVDRGKCQNEISYEKCRNNEVYDGI